MAPLSGKACTSLGSSLAVESVSDDTEDQRDRVATAVPRADLEALVHDLVALRGEGAAHARPEVAAVDLWYRDCDAGGGAL